jgi:circadian clock protein KaiC
MTPPLKQQGARISSGIPGLDNVLGGGFDPHHVYLVEGDPGAGKTTLALKHLLDGDSRGERCLYVTLSESAVELRAVAASHGWSLGNIDLFELVPSEESLQSDSHYTMFHPSEVELGQTTREMLAEFERIGPSRVVIDSLSEIRLLAQNPLRFRRQILALKQFFIGRSCTVLLIDDRSAESNDPHLRSLAHGVISLEQLTPEFGAARRRLRVIKMRGSSYRDGYHDMLIVRGGLKVFPRLVASEHRQRVNKVAVPSNIPELDALVGGGLDSGTSTLVIGPAGSGKSSLCAHYAIAAAKRGEGAAIFTFDESVENMLTRCRGLGMNLEPYISSGHITIQQIDPAELSPGEFSHAIREAVERTDGPPAKVVVIDSLNGYLNAMPGERFMIIQLHELLTFLNQTGVITFLIAAQHGLVSSSMSSPIDASYLADNVILMRYFESKATVKVAISVVKKRTGQAERTIREIWMDGQGIHLGPPLLGFSGILAGNPTSLRDDAALSDISR